MDPSGMNTIPKMTLGPGVDAWTWICAVIGTSAGAVMITVLLWHRFFKKLPQQLVFGASTGQFLFASAQFLVSLWSVAWPNKSPTFSECAGISSVRWVALGISNLGNSGILFAFYYMIKSVRRFAPISWTPLRQYLVGMGAFVATTWALLTFQFTSSVNWVFLDRACIPIPKPTGYHNTMISIVAGANSLVPVFVGIVLFTLAFRERSFFLKKKADEGQLDEQNGEPTTAIDELCGYFSFYRALSISWFVCQFPFALSVLVAIPFPTVKVVRFLRILAFQWVGVQPVFDLSIYLYYLPGPFAQRGLGKTAVFGRTTVATSSNDYTSAGSATDPEAEIQEV